MEDKLVKRSDGWYFTGFDCGTPVWSADEKEAKPVNPEADDLIISVLRCRSSCALVDKMQID